MSKIPQYYTVQQVADKLVIHTDTVKNWIEAKKLTAVKIGRAYRIAETDLAKLIASHTIYDKSFK